MSLEELDHWLERLDPPPLVEGVSMLDGYLTAIIIGPCSIDPHQWLRHMLGPNGRLGLQGAKQAAASATLRSLSAPMAERSWLAPGAWDSWPR